MEPSQCDESNILLFLEVKSGKENKETPCFKGF